MYAVHPLFPLWRLASSSKCASEYVHVLTCFSPQRDATQRESLTTTLRTLRSDSLRQTTELERLQTKHAEAQRRLGIADASERALKLQLKGAEQAQRGMKEEMARMKVLVQQTRNQCAVEVRKRERVIEGLKKHVGDGRIRGGGKTVGVREITVVPGIGGEQQAGGMGLTTADEGYDLRSETNEFLTELARGLSEENENLAALVRRTVETLRTSSGWERPGQQEGGMVVSTEVGYEGIASDVDAVLEHVQTLLTNPSFVPLEEVEVREEEIIRLREGWEKMENRWREAVQMMEGWRKRMARSGQTVNLEELKMGLMLSPLKTKDQEEDRNLQLSTLMEEGEGDTQADIDAMEAEEMAGMEEPDFDDGMDDSASSLFEDEPIDEQEEVSEPSEQQEQEPEEEGYSLHTASSLSIGPPPQLSPLKETSGNQQRAAAPSPPCRERDREGFSTIMEENTFDFLELESSSPPKTALLTKSTPQRSFNPDPREQSATQQRRQQKSATKLTVSTPSDDELALSLVKTSNPTPQPRSAKSAVRQRSASPKKISRPTPKLAATPRLKIGNESRLPRPRDALPQQSPLTMASIAAKLAASEREADAARVRAKIKAARANRAGATSNITSSSSSADADKKSMPPPAIRLVPNDDEEELLRGGSTGSGTANWEVNGTDSGRERDEGRQAESEMKGKKRRAPGRTQGGRDKASRRRSTLSPWELESLILGGVPSPGKQEV